MSWDLTRSEMRVLEQAARGLSCVESAKESCHEAQTVKFHRHHILQKLGAKNITHAVALAYQQDLLPLKKAEAA